MNSYIYTEWLGQIEDTKYKSCPIVLKPEILQWFVCFKIIWHLMEKNIRITIIWLIAIWVFESFSPKIRYFFLCRDILATDEITDDEVSDDAVAEMRSRYFAQQQVIQRQHISVS